MRLKSLCVALFVACCGLAAQAAPINVYNTASFVQVADGSYKLNGFGRGTSNFLTAGLDTLGDVPFFDTWNIDVSAIAPGSYNFGPLVVDAVGALTFTSLTFNSYDEAGVRQSVLFDLNASGTQALASGSFTVRTSCPVASCVWIDVTGMQPPLASGAGYGGTTVATVVPEPASAALLALGLTAVGALARRRRLHTA